ncbi:unnamed protein product (mitochondrion) [Plasmodiophora brassicae]|uniref:Uncharacterized protein n=1 Tax=Plasmodiophora brassicae TaxID=37360 RepID=A0A3P3YK47_PLABS|nr:unnamed protein product [Plasmodiophora brassicae]
MDGRVRTRRCRLKRHRRGNCQMRIPVRLTNYARRPPIHVRYSLASGHPGQAAEQPPAPQCPTQEEVGELRTHQPVCAGSDMSATGLPSDFFSASRGARRASPKKKKNKRAAAPASPEPADKKARVAVQAPADSNPEQLIEAFLDLQADVAQITGESVKESAQLTATLDEHRAAADDNEQRELEQRVQDLKRKSEAYKARRLAAQRPKDGRNSGGSRAKAIDPDSVWRSRAI